ncbi:MAG: hypothetical protein RJB64_365, partial [Pseudomonadota bacterium]
MAAGVMVGGGTAVAGMVTTVDTAIGLD